MKSIYLAIGFILLLSSCNLYEAEKKFYNNLLSDGELDIKFTTKGYGEQSVEMNFEFKGNKVVSYYCNNPNFKYTPVANLDCRFTIIDGISGGTLVLKTPTNPGSFDLPDWDKTLDIDIDNLESFKGLSGTLNGSVTIHDVVVKDVPRIASHEMVQEASSESDDATFYVTINKN